MLRSILVVDLPPDSWIRALADRAPGASLRVLSMLDGGADVGFLEVRAPGPDPVLPHVPGDPHLEVLASSGDRAVVRFSTLAAAVPPPLAALTTPGMSLTLGPGVVRVPVGGTVQELRQAVATLEAAGLPCSMVHEADDGAGPGALTARQLEVLRRAAELGYYDTPRRASLTEVAAKVGVSKSTASDILHRAEGKVVRGYLADRPPRRPRRRSPS